MELWALLSMLWPIAGVVIDSQMKATLERGPKHLQIIRRRYIILFMVVWLLMIGFYILRFVTSDISNILLSDHPENVLRMPDLLIVLWPVLWFVVFLGLRAITKPKTVIPNASLTVIRNICLTLWCIVSLCAELYLIFIVSFARSPL